MTAGDQRHALLRPAIIVPFLLVALIWGSTWFVIKDQLVSAPPPWSVAYRFAIAAVGMWVLAALGGGGFRMTAKAHGLAVGIGLSWFFLNYNLVYQAELYLTSGVVAVLFALLMLPNALLGAIFLGQRLTRRFLLGTLVALAGIVLLLIHEANEAPLSGQVGLGIALTALAILSASIANVLQGTETAREHPVPVLFVWSMLWGTLACAALAWATTGPPVFPDSARYWGGVVYLALIGSVVTFPLYFRLIRDLGPGRAAYNGVLVPIVAMGLSTALEGYVWSGLAMAGAILAIIGMVIALRGRNAPLARSS